MILERALAAPGDEDDLFDPGLQRLFDRILDQRLVDDGQHLLGHRLGRGQKPRAQASDGKNSLSDRLDGHKNSLLRRGGIAQSGGGTTPANPHADMALRGEPAIFDANVAAN